jgi:two-component system sensor histidine kinase UhpB
MRGQVVAGTNTPTELSREPEDERALAERVIKQHVARELHDRVAQTLTGMLIELETFKVQQFGRESVLREATELQDSTRQVLQSIREMLYDLRGEPASEESFVSVLQGLLSRFEERTRIAVELMVSPSWPKKVRSAAALNLYRIVEEALTNIRLHSGARSVRVALEWLGGAEVALIVRDDGGGVDSPESLGLGGMGVLGMRERAVLLGGRLTVESNPGGGTTVRAVVPEAGLC